jgi:phage FluMu protein Com
MSDNTQEKFTVPCTHCGKTLQAKDELIGKQVRCPSCKEIFTVQKPGPTPSEEPPATPAPSSQAPPASTTKRGWRRRWKAVSREHRIQAVSSLADIFTPPKERNLLFILLIVSLIGHALSLPLIGAGKQLNIEEAIDQQDSYLKKIMHKERAKVVADEVAKKTTMPPPPPDPEKFVSDTITKELTTDLAQVTSGLLDVKLEKSLIDHVQGSLEQEIKEQSKQISKGKLSKDQIKQLQRQFKEKALTAAREWREEHREEYQVPIAAKTVTEWYEENVASQIKGVVQWELFTKTGQYKTPLWHIYFNRHHQGNHPGFIQGPRDQSFVRTCQIMPDLAKGIFAYHWFWERQKPDDLDLRACKKMQHNNVLLPDWPKPSKLQAVMWLILIEDMHTRWFGSFDFYVSDYYPHRMDEIKMKRKELEGLWNKLLAAARNYKKAAKAKKPEAELKKLQTSCSALINTIYKKADAVIVSNEQGKGRDLEQKYHIINQTLRSRVLRGTFREEAYRFLINTLVEKIRPPVEQLAESQFREGLVLSEKGVHEAMKEFRVKAAVLLKRDMEKVVSRPMFHAKIFYSGRNPYKNKVTKESGPPSQEDIKKDEAALKKVLEKWPEKDRDFPKHREEMIKKEVKGAMLQAVNEMLKRLVTKDGRLQRNYYARAGTVDYADPFKEKLDARDMAWKGRRQDLADLTEQGVPDTSTPLVALESGAATGRLALKPVLATMYPGFFVNTAMPAKSIRWSQGTSPPPPAEWGFVTQSAIKAPFKSPGTEAIPFLPNFPSIDGDLSDWGSIRPIILSHDNCQDAELRRPSIMLYMAWNYQGFFFGYSVKQKRIGFTLPSRYELAEDGITLVKRRDAGQNLLDQGDFFDVCIDTLDARLPFRGDPHVQEFIICPMGTAMDPTVPGCEKVIASRRDGKRAHGVGAQLRYKVKVFPPQPRSGADGSGPFRVTKLEDDKYTVEIFLPRSLFNTPVFCPGWWIGLDAHIGTGKQPSKHGFNGKGWLKVRGHGIGPGRGYAPARSNKPHVWGDVLLLGTDARVTIQDAAHNWPLSTAVIPGHSYLITVVDPDRNVNLAGIDTVLVSAEVAPVSKDPKVKPDATDMELFILKETGKNTSIFRGYINTQPGIGSKVQGYLEVFPSQEIRFAYVDFADSKGRRNVVYEQKLPVVSPVITPVSK